MVSFDEGGEPAWRVELSSGAAGSPAIRDDRVYVGTMQRDSGVYALDRRDGEVVWSSGGGDDHLSSITLAEDYLLATTRSELKCMDLEAGDLLWRYDDAEGETAPAVEDGVVYHAASGRQEIVALDVKSGEELWTQSTSDDPGSSPTVGDDFVYAASKDGVVYALDPENGDLEWSRRFPRGRIGYRGASNQSPAVGEDGVFVAMDDSLHKLDFSGDSLWRTVVSNPGSPVVSDEEVVLTTRDGVRCVDADSGDFLWSFGPPSRVDGDVQHSGVQSPVYVDDGVVYLASVAGDIYAFDGG